MAKKNSARRRTRALVVRTADTSGFNIAAPDLVAGLLRDHWSSFYDDKEVARDLFTIALSDITRDVIARHATPAGDQDEQQMQLDLWPAGERSIASELGLMRTFIPSRRSHIALYDPARITPEEIAEGGHYLISHGHGCIKRGNTLLRLARLRGLNPLVRVA